MDKKQERDDEMKTQTSDWSCTCCWEPGALGLMLSALVRGWNVVYVWAPPAVLDGMIPNTFC